MATTITVSCPQCKHKMRASSEHIGRSGRCPACKSLVQIAPSLEESQRSVIKPTGKVDAPDVAPSSGTRINAWLAGLIGAAVTVLLYVAVFFPFANTYIGQLMTDRGWVQYAITMVVCWGLAILALKYIAVQRELRTAELELDLIPLDIGLQITPENVDQFLDHLGKLPPAQRQGLMAQRLGGALEHFKHRHNVSEVQSYLATQAQLEASGVDTGYTMMRVFIWVCPILGFIGTVLGISDAVNGLAKSLVKAPAAQSAPAQPAPAGQGGGSDLGKAMLAGMREVTDGLARAFDTTLVGLIGVILLMFPCEALRKTEYEMLDRIEDFANDYLLRRMAEGENQDFENMPQVVRNSLEGAFREHQRWLMQWQAQVARLGESLGAGFESAARDVQERMSKADGERQEQISRSERERLDQMQHLSRVVDQLFQKATETAQTLTKERLEGFHEAVHSMGQLQQSLTANTATLGQVVSQQRQSVDQYATLNLGDVLHGLQQAISHLAHKLDEPAPLVDGSRAPGQDHHPSRGLFGWFKK